MVEFQEIKIKLNGINELRNELNYLNDKNIFCVNGFISKLIIIVNININYIVYYSFKHETYYTFFNKELKKLL